MTTLEIELEWKKEDLEALESIANNAIGSLIEATIKDAKLWQALKEMVAINHPEIEVWHDGSITINLNSVYVYDQYHGYDIWDDIAHKRKQIEELEKQLSQKKEAAALKHYKQGDLVVFEIPEVTSEIGMVVREEPDGVAVATQDPNTNWNYFYNYEIRLATKDECIEKLREIFWDCAYREE